MILARAALWGPGEVPVDLLAFAHEREEVYHFIRLGIFTLRDDVVIVSNGTTARVWNALSERERWHTWNLAELLASSCVLTPNRVNARMVCIQRAAQKDPVRGAWMVQQYKVLQCFF